MARGETMNDKNATHTTGMSDAAKESRQAYYKAWRAKNKDRIHEYNANYWAKRAERENKERGETQCSQTY